MAVSDGTVRVLAVPSGSALRELKVGDSIELETVGTTRIDSDGAWSLETNDLTAPVSEPGETWDATVLVVSDSSFSTHNMSLEVDGSGESRVIPGHTAATHGERGEQARGAQGTLSTRDAETLDLALGGDAAMAGVNDVEGPVVMTFVKDLGNRLSYVGSAHAQTGSGFTNKFTYTTGGSSSLGIGTTSGGGGWRAGGTRSESTSSTTTWPAISGSTHKVYGTNFNYGEYRYGSQKEGIFWNEARPRYHHGGAYTYSAAMPAAPSANCGDYPAGGTFTKNEDLAVTWSAGVKLDSMIGIDLSSRSGYSTSVRNDFTFDTAKRVCGEFTGPGGDSGRLTVKNP